MSQDQFVKQTKETHKAAILAKPNVVGVGVGEKTIRGQKTGETCVVVMVRQKARSPADRSRHHRY